LGPLAHGYDRTRMQIRLLGHFDVSVGDRPIALGGAKQRAVLAMLVLEANRTVTADSLIEGVWGEQPPLSAAKMLQNYVWRLRRALADGGPEIGTRGGGYELRVDPETVDVQRLERLVSEQRRAAAAGQPTSAARQALALFRGEPLADLVDGRSLGRRAPLRSPPSPAGGDCGAQLLTCGDYRSRRALVPQCIAWREGTTTARACTQANRSSSPSRPDWTARRRGIPLDGRRALHRQENPGGDGGATTLHLRFARSAAARRGAEPR
jgi:DNA-binding winged helix-turn-helix (wHTH) protein